MSNTTKVAELQSLLVADDEAKFVAQYWDKFYQQQQGHREEKIELRNYIFATDTTTTSNAALPWKNSTTLPKLCQIRDNLHSNYISALFPNDKWLSWISHNAESAKHEKARVIRGYMDNKAREGHLRSTVSNLLYDYIDGNAFATVVFESSYYEKDGERVPNFIGPKLVRISPFDIVFNPLAVDINKTAKVVRSVETIGSLKKLVDEGPEYKFWEKAIANRERIRQTAGGYSVEDFNKASQFSVDGFGNMYEYYQSDYIEILEFYGDYHDQSTGELHTNRVLTIVDRSIIVRNEPIETYSGIAPIFHVGWRKRPDNLWAMGPLDNLVGLQYRLDHLENLKADAMDLIVHPPLKIIGEVEEFVWSPGAQIIIDEGGSDVMEVSKSMQGIVTAASEIQQIQDYMELYAGAPREAMGIRTPGEKTAFEVDELMTAAGRIFQEKITNFEVELLEPALNSMLESAQRNLDTSDVIRVIDDEFGTQEFLEITKADITANGVLRPIGARHFSQKSQDLQNVVGVFNTKMGEMLAPHTSTKGLMDFVEDVLDITGYDIFRFNVGIEEQKETQRLINQSSEDLEVEAQGPTIEDIPAPPPQEASPEGAPLEGAPVGGPPIGNI